MAQPSGFASSRAERIEQCCPSVSKSRLSLPLFVLLWEQVRGSKGQCALHEAQNASQKVRLQPSPGIRKRLVKSAFVLQDFFAFTLWEQDVAGFINKKVGFRLRFFVSALGALHKKSLRSLREAFVGRGDRIRTCDLLLPKQALYQAELRPDFFATLTAGALDCGIKTESKGVFWVGFRLLIVHRLLGFYPWAVKSGNSSGHRFLTRKRRQALRVAQAPTSSLRSPLAAAMQSTV